MRILPPVQPTSKELSVLARVVWGPHRFRIVETFKDAYRLECSDGHGTVRKLKFDDIQGLLDSGELVLEEGHFNLDGTPAAKDSPYKMISTCTPAEQYFIVGKLIWMRLFHAAYTAGEVKKYKESVDPWVQVNYPVWLEEMKAFFDHATVEKEKQSGKKRKVRRGQPTGDVGVPSCSSLKADHLIYILPNFRPTQFRPNFDNCIYGGKRLSTDLVTRVELIIRQHYADEGRCTVAELTRYIAARLPDGVKAPHEQTVAKIIKTFPDARMIGSRYGLKVMRESRGMFSEGPRYTMAGEMVYIDAWKTDIVVILKHCGAWMKFNRHDRRTIESVKERVWVCVAMDIASRVILGMAFGLAESSELARRVLRMVVSDRSDYAEMAGCKHPPPRQIGVAAIRTDSGPAFIDGAFALSALSITGDVAVGIVGRPNYRGPLERFFRTVGSQLLSYFTGRAFSNVVERGEYDHEARASLILEDFGNAFFRYINDIYHLRGHSALWKQPPINYFNSALATTGCPDVLTSDEIRCAFAIRVTRTLTPAGIRYMNVEYRANWLADLLRDGGKQEIEFLVDPANLGAISVIHNNQFHTVLGPPELQNVGVTRLLQTYRELERKHGAEADVLWPIVAEAMRDIADLGAKARVEAGLLDTGYDSDALDKAERSMGIRVVYRPSPDAYRHPLSITQGGLGRGTPVTGSSAPLALPAPDTSGEEDDDVADEYYEPLLDPDDDPRKKEDEDNSARPMLPDGSLTTPLAIPSVAPVTPAPKVSRRFKPQEDHDE